MSVRMNRRRQLTGSLVAALLLLTAAAAPLRAKTLKVGISGTPPFVIKTGSEWSGISLDVWRTVAIENNLSFELIPQSSPDEGLQAIDDETIDVLVGPISITSRRLAIPNVNFTQPYFFAKAGVLVPTRPPSLFDRFKVFFGRAVLSSILILIAVLAAVGTLVWLAERRCNQENFPHPPLEGIFNGMWFALVTLTTVGYGDKAPITKTGRIITSTWMVISLIAVSSLTASLASAFTLFLSGASDTPITSSRDLINRRVAVVEGTSNVRLAESGGMIKVMAKNLSNAAELVANGQVDALIFDRPALRFFLKQRTDLDLKVAPFTLAEETYGFAFKTGSDLNTPLDVSILKMQRNGLVKELTDQNLN